MRPDHPYRLYTGDNALIEHAAPSPYHIKHYSNLVAGIRDSNSSSYATGSISRVPPSHNLSSQQVIGKVLEQEEQLRVITEALRTRGIIV